MTTACSGDLAQKPRVLCSMAVDAAAHPPEQVARFVQHFFGNQPH